MKSYKGHIDPATRGGQLSLDEALSAFMFEDVVGFKKTGPQRWKLIYEDGRVSRADIVGCSAFELSTLDLKQVYR